MKEYTIALEVFDRSADYDPAVDATVRVEAGRLRSRLREYYAEEGVADRLIFSLPKGGYRVVLTMGAEARERAKEAFAGDMSLERQKLPGDAAQTEETAASPIETAGTLGAGVGLPVKAAAERALPWWDWLEARGSLALMLVAAGLLAGFGVWRLARRQHRPPMSRTMAVLPLKNLSGDTGQDYFADGTTDELITELARVPELRVVSWNSAEQEKGTTKSLRAIAEELHADVLVEGSVARSGETVRINVQLVDAKADTHLWASSLEGRAGEMMALESRAAQEIVAHARVGGGLVTAEPVRLPTMVDPAAHEAYLRGRNYLDKRQGRAAAEEFQRAVEASSNYAAAYTGLAMALESEALLGEASAENAIPRALAAVERSLALDPENGDALIARGSLETSFLWQWEAAKSDLTRGLALSPNNSYGHMMLSVYFDAMGRPDEAVRQMQAAVEIDPLSFFMARHYGSTLLFARRYEEALRQLAYAREMHPASAVVVDGWMSAAYEKEGRYDEAVRYDLLEAKEGGEIDSEALLAMYQGKGWRAYWTMRLAGMRQARVADACEGYFEGLVAARAGRPGEAIAALKDASERRCYWMVLTRTNPLLDDVRGEPGFAEVLVPLHLPAEAAR